MAPGPAAHAALALPRSCNGLVERARQTATPPKQEVTPIACESRAAATVRTRGSFLALFLSLGACDEPVDGLYVSCGPKPPKTEVAAAPDDAPSHEETLVEIYDLEREPSSVITVRKADVKIMPTLELEFDDEAKPFEVVKAPKSRKIYSGKNLWLHGYWPVANDRVFVKRTSERSEYSKAIDYQLIDLKDGAVLGTYHRVQGQYREVGFAFGTEKHPVSGETRGILIHVSDGLAIPLDEFGGHDDDFIVFPNAKHGYAVYIRPANARDAKGTSRYAVWTDLRKPPPPLNHTLPFIVPENDEDDRRETYLTPSDLNPFDGPTVVWGENAPDDCKRASFWPGEEKHRCHTVGFPLNDEWTLYEGIPFEADAVLNHETNTLYQIDLTPDPCSSGLAIERGTLDPLRLFLGCAGSLAQMVWTPDGVWQPEFDEGRMGGTPHWSRDRSIRAAAFSKDGALPDIKWFEMRSPRRVVFPLHAQIYSFVAGIRTPTEPLWDRKGLWVIDLETEEFRPLDVTSKCARFERQASDGDLWAYRCLGRNGRPLSMKLTHLKGRQLAPIPLQKDMLIGGRTVVSIAAHGSHNEILVWEVDELIASSTP